MLGPEELAVRAAEVARLHRTRPDGWASVVAAGAERLAWHTGLTGAVAWSDAVAAQLAAGELDAPTAIDALLAASYLAEGHDATPCVHAAQALFAVGRGGAAFAVLCAGLGAAGEAWRDRVAPALAAAWPKGKLDVPFAFEQAAAAMFAALQGGDPARAEKLGRWAVAFDPDNGEAHRNLGLALAMQGKVVDALHHLVRATREQATQILSGTLFQAGQVPAAMAVLDYASRWYVRAEQWLTYGGVAYGAMDNPRTIKAYQLAYQLDPSAFDCSQLNAYAGVLDEVGDYATCARIAEHLLRDAGDDLTWRTCGWNHLACAYLGQGRFAEAADLAARAVAQNPLPDNAAGFALTLDKAQSEQRSVPPVDAPAGAVREEAFLALERGELAAVAARLDDPSWRVRRAALRASRFRFTSENQLEVTPRASAAAGTILGATIGAVDPIAAHCRNLALELREQAHFARDPVPTLGDRMTRDAFYAEFRARGGVVLGDDAPPPPPFVDREVMPGSRVARASDYVALLRDLAALTPREALSSFHLDEAEYVEVARTWAAAMAADPTIARAIAAGLAKR
jgi:tetratricopeptide (TPR) repeat protein